MVSRYKFYRNLLLKNSVRRYVVYCWCDIPSEQTWDQFHLVNSNSKFLNSNSFFKIINSGIELTPCLPREVYYTHDSYKTPALFAAIIFLVRAATPETRQFELQPCVVAHLWSYSIKTIG